MALAQPNDVVECYGGLARYGAMESYAVMGDQRAVGRSKLNLKRYRAGQA